MKARALHALNPHSRPERKPITAAEFNWQPRMLRASPDDQPINDLQDDTPRMRCERFHSHTEARRRQHSLTCQGLWTPEIYVVDCCPALTKLQTNNFHAHLSCALPAWKLLVSYPPNDALPPAVTIDRSCDCAICLISCPFTPQRYSTQPSRAPLKPVMSSSRRQLYRHLDEPLACLTSTSELELHASASSY